MLDKAWIERVRESTDIVDVVGRYVDLKRQGRELLGLCPFHGERTPSFTVSRRKGFYHCFGCGEHGSAIDFLMTFSGMGFLDAVRTLAQEAGIVEPDFIIGSPGKGGDRRSRQPPARLPQRRPGLEAINQEMREREVTFTPEQTQAMWEASQNAQRFFSGHLQNRQSGAESEPQEVRAAMDYLFRKRGLSLEIVHRYGLGFAPGGKDALFKALPDSLRPGAARAGLLSLYAPGAKGSPPVDPFDLSDAVILEGGLMVDRFRGRLMFPIRDAQGQVCGFAGRDLPPEKAGSPKYLNTPATPIFNKGTLLYGLFEAREAIARSGCVVVVEGYLDVIALAQKGTENAVASMGTSCTSDQIRALFELASEVVFCFDGDPAGRRAMRRAMKVCLPMMDDQHRVKFLDLPDGDDPDSHVRRVGGDAFERQRIQAQPMEEYAIEILREGLDLLRESDRIALHERAQEMVDQMQSCVVQKRIALRAGELAGKMVRLPRTAAGRGEDGLPVSVGLLAVRSQGGLSGDAGDRPTWLRHLCTVADIGRRSPDAAFREDLVEGIVKLVSMLEDDQGMTTAGDGERPWSETVREMLRVLESGAASQDEKHAKISPEDLEDLRGAMRLAELGVLDRACTLCLSREELTQGERSRLIRSLHARKSEILRAGSGHKQPSVMP